MNGHIILHKTHVYTTKWATDKLVKQSVLNKRQLKRDLIAWQGLEKWLVYYVGLRRTPQQFLKGIHVVLAGHDHTEDVPPDICVHSLFAGLIQNLGAKLGRQDQNPYKVILCPLREQKNIPHKFRPIQTSSNIQM